MNDSPSFLKVNPEKEEFVTAGGRTFACYAIVTEVVTGKTDLTAFLLHYAAPLLREGDILLLSEKLVACAQGKARPVESIRPGSLARFLCRFVRKTDYGIGLSIPETMQCALDECGAPRILLAAAVGAAGPAFGEERVVLPGGGVPGRRGGRPLPLYHPAARPLRRPRAGPAG